MHPVISKEELEHTTKYIESLTMTNFMHLFINQVIDFKKDGFNFNDQAEPHIVHSWLKQIKIKLNRLDWL